MHDAQERPKLLGLVNQKSLMFGTNSDQFVQFGLFQPFYQFHGQVGFLRADQGIVTDFMPAPRERHSAIEKGLLQLPADFEGPLVNEPVHVALLYKREDPELLFSAWDEVAGYACGLAFPYLCQQMREHPFEGHHLATFLTNDVELFIQHAVGGGGFDFEKAAPQVREFAKIRDALAAVQPEWAQNGPSSRRFPPPRGFDPSFN